MRRSVTLQPGAVLDLAQLEAELDALRTSYRAEGYWRSRVGTPRIIPVLAGLAEVEIEVRAGPRISFGFRGNRIYADEQLRLAMAWSGEEQLDRAMVRDLAARIERAYRLAGWHDARVVTTEKQAKDSNELRIFFHVDEGRPLYVAGVRFDGAHGLPPPALQALFEQSILASRGPEPLLMPLGRGELDAAFGKGVDCRPSGLDPLHVYDDELYEQVLEALRARYRDEGFLEAQIESPRVSIDERRRVAHVTIPIDEGRRTRIAKVEFPGATSVDTAAFLASMPALAPRRPLSEPRLREARVQLQALYARRGYLYATVDVEVVRPPEDPHAATVRLHVVEGPEVRAGRILVQGNRRTDASVIEDALLFREGGVVGSEELAESQQRLMRLGIFRTAAIRPLDPDVAEPVKDLVVDCASGRSARSKSAAACRCRRPARVHRVHRAEHPRPQPRVRGARPRELPGLPRGSARDAVREGPRALRGSRPALPAHLRPAARARLARDLIHERDIRPAYALTKYSALTGFDWPAQDWLQTSLIFEAESNSTARSARIDELYGELSRRDLERLRFPEGDTLLGSVRPGFVLDLRDDPVAPQSGLFAKVEADYARSLLDDPVHFVKMRARSRATCRWRSARRSRSRSAAAASSSSTGRARRLAKALLPGRRGIIRGFTEDGVVPEDRREALRRQMADCKAIVFGAGCSDAARFLQQGQSVPSDGGDLYVLARSELRFPIRGDLMGGVFLDAGNLWLDTSSFDPTQLRTASGAGLRYATPVGPVALDLGVNLDPDESLNESRFALHFSIGLF